MNERGYIRIPRIWLILMVIAIVIIAGICIIVLIGNISDKTGNINRNNAQELIENIVDDKDYTRFDEGIMEDELPRVKINVIAEKDSTIDGRIPCFYNPVIPQGFKAVGNEQDVTIDENARWGEQNAYLYGLVIEDSNKNQFVWVPVENMEIFKRTEWQGNKPKEKISSTYIEPLKDEEEEYQKMYYKVKKYGGFYIGRYETGDATANTERTAVKNSDSIGIRKYLNSYNYVPFTQSAINGREIIGAQELAINFGKQYKSITTSVVYGIQWDALLRFVSNDINNVNNSSRWGNYVSSELTYTDIYGSTLTKKSGDVRLLKTGASEETKAKNIYDVAGNLYEWTMETSRNATRVVRGGCYVVNVGELAAFRYAYNDNTANNAIGFRISFYID